MKPIMEIVKNQFPTMNVNGFKIVQNKKSFFVYEKYKNEEILKKEFSKKNYSFKIVLNWVENIGAN
tara:strand:+ start:94 stop:291 length:198 start_codon:yes stop_codon:yes gene_type:complete